MKVGRELALARKWQRLTFDQLAHLTGAPAGDLRAIERGDVARVSSGTDVATVLRAYASAVGLDADTVIRNYSTRLTDDVRPADRAAQREAVDASLVIQSSIDRAALNVLSQFPSERDLDRGVAHPRQQEQASPCNAADQATGRHAFTAADSKCEESPRPPDVSRNAGDTAAPASDRPRRLYVSAASAAVIAVAMYLAFPTMPALGPFRADSITRARADRPTQPNGSDALYETRGGESSSHGARDPHAIRSPDGSSASGVIAEAQSDPPSTRGPVVSSRGQRNAAAAPEDVNGWWDMTNQVQSSSYAAYRRLRLGYRLQLQQHGSRITGQGQKWSENGRRIPGATRTPITVDGVIEGRRVALRFVERGHRRTSGGSFDLMLANNGLLAGTFESDAAHSRGSSSAQRVSATPSAQ